MDETRFSRLMGIADAQVMEFANWEAPYATTNDEILAERDKRAKNAILGGAGTGAAGLAYAGMRRSDKFRRPMLQGEAAVADGAKKVGSAAMKYGKIAGGKLAAGGGKMKTILVNGVKKLGFEDADGVVHFSDEEEKNYKPLVYGAGAAGAAGLGYAGLRKNKYTRDAILRGEIKVENTIDNPKREWKKTKKQVRGVQRRVGAGLADAKQSVGSAYKIGKSEMYVAGRRAGEKVRALPGKIADKTAEALKASKKSIRGALVASAGRMKFQSAAEVIQFADKLVELQDRLTYHLAESGETPRGRLLRDNDEAMNRYINDSRAIEGLKKGSVAGLLLGGAAGALQGKRRGGKALKGAVGGAFVGGLAGEAIGGQHYKKEKR